MPQLTAVSTRGLSRLNMPSNGPASQLAASWIAPTIALPWFALSRTRAMPTIRISATIDATRPITRARRRRPEWAAAAGRLRPAPVRPVVLAAMRTGYPFPGRSRRPEVPAARPLERAAVHPLLQRVAEAQRPPVLAAEALADLLAREVALLAQQVLDQRDLAVQPPLVLVRVRGGRAGERGVGGAHRSPPVVVRLSEEERVSWEERSKRPPSALREPR